ncbi:MAG: DUF4367 domain-containing protein [Oscillibacter sp.]|nr:DUF4367 domain-containing protein [Oscillibacter sp.]
MSGFRFPGSSEGNQSGAGDEFPFSDAELGLAAQAVRTSLLSSLPDPSACRHTFSNRFRREMDAVCRQARRRERLRICLHRAAIIMIAILTGLSIWLAVDTGARAELIRWVRQTVGDWTEYSFFPRENAGILPEYDLYWLPDGYAKTPLITQDDKHISRYENRKTGESFRFRYAFMDDSHWITVPAEESRTAVRVFDTPADFYTGAESNTLIWMNEDLYFTLEGPLDSAAMLRIAESASLCQDTILSWRISWLPEGYQVSRYTESAEKYDVHYENGSGKTVHFLYYRMPAGELALIPPSDWLRKDADSGAGAVRPEAELYESPDGRYRLLAWIDEAQRITFYLYSEEQPDVMERIAESIFQESGASDR